MVNKKAKMLGGVFAPYVSYAVARNKESSRWIASKCWAGEPRSTERNYGNRQKETYLQESKRLEAELDAEIKRVRDIIAREEYNRQNPRSASK